MDSSIDEDDFDVIPAGAEPDLVCLHEGRDLRVFFSDQGGDLLVVTFSKFTPNPPANLFGHAFLHKYGISFIAIQAQDNHWYNTDELLGLRGRMDAIRAQYARVITYGSSMGGHGAVLWADFFGADRAVAVAPQFSIDPAVVPGDDRWNAQWQVIRARGLTPPVAFSRRAEKVILFDPFTRTDAVQARHFAALGHVRFLPVSFSGHGPLSTLKAAGLLSQVTLMLFTPRIDFAAIRTVIRDSQRQSEQYWIGYAEHRYGTRDPGRALALAEQSLGLGGAAPDWHSLMQLAMLAKRAGGKAKAVDYIERSVAVSAQAKNVAMAARLLTKANPKLPAADVLKRLEHLAPDSDGKVLRYAAAALAKMG